MVQIAVNTRFKSQKITGAQRYAREVSRRFQQPFREIAPPRSTGGVRGRLWEQTELPLLCRSDLLWSPINLGPIARRRQVVTMHDVSPIEHPEWFDRSYSSWYRWLMPRVARRVQHVITDSEYTRQRVISLTGAEPSRVTAIPLGADQTFSKRAPAEIEKVKSRFGIQSRHYLLSLCTLEPRKNLKRLLAVWSELEQEISRDWSLVLAGGTGASGVFAAEPLLADMPKVIYTGYVEDELLPALISGADAFIYPSLYEGFGLPVLEAMACEVAVISSNATSLPEVTGEDGALLVSPTDSVAIGKAIRSVIDDKQMRIRLGHAGGRRAAKFSWDRCAAETESLLLREAAVRKAFFSREETA